MTDIKIIQIQGMPNDRSWQGNVLGLADNGKVYISCWSNDAECVVWDEYISAPPKEKG